MATYNTGNALGSTDARDLSDNAQNLDKAVNGTDEKWTDRLGRQRAALVAIDNVISSLDVANFTFDSKELGLAATTSGQYFRVPQGADADISFIYYKNSNGQAESVAVLSGKAAVDAVAADIANLTETIDDDANIVNAMGGFIDLKGQLALYFNQLGQVVLGENNVNVNESLKTLFVNINSNFIFITTRYG
jgi:hypothetical protein